jgi:hypothetical protein
VRRFYSRLRTAVVDEAFRCAFRDALLGALPGTPSSQVLKLSRMPPTGLADRSLQHGGETVRFIPCGALAVEPAVELVGRVELAGLNWQNSSRAPPATFFPPPQQLQGTAGITVEVLGHDVSEPLLSAGHGHRRELLDRGQPAGCALGSRRGRRK